MKSCAVREFLDGNASNGHHASEAELLAVREALRHVQVEAFKASTKLTQAQADWPLPFLALKNALDRVISIAPVYTLL